MHGKKIIVNLCVRMTLNYKLNAYGWRMHWALLLLIRSWSFSISLSLFLSRVAFSMRKMGNNRLSINGCCSNCVYVCVFNFQLSLYRSVLLSKTSSKIPLTHSLTLAVVCSSSSEWQNCHKLHKKNESNATQDVHWWAHECITRERRYLFNVHSQAKLRFT